MSRKKGKVYMIYIIGHTKPDLDSAVAPISLKFLFDKVDCFERKNAIAVLASEANHEIKTLFTKFTTTPVPAVLTKNQIKPEDTFVLVDHNEVNQRLAGIENDKITDIFDHHKVSLNLSTPIFITIHPWGSTNTLIYWLMKKYNVRPDKNLASLMISAILSDTIGLKGPTTTDVDRGYLKELNKIAQIKDINALTLAIFKAKSDINNLSAKQILTKDYKLYDFAGKKVFISQLETFEQKKLVNKSEELIRELTQLKKEMKLDNAICILSDVLNFNSKAIAAPEDEEVLIKAFVKLKKVKTGVYDIGPLMSRKKEIAPAIEKAMKE